MLFERKIHGRKPDWTAKQKRQAVENKKKKSEREDAVCTEHTACVHPFCDLHWTLNGPTLYKLKLIYITHKKIHFAPHREHNALPLERPLSECCTIIHSAGNKQGTVCTITTSLSRVNNMALFRTALRIWKYWSVLRCDAVSTGAVSAHRQRFNFEESHHV
jgi:hypothetical protein